MRYLKTACKYTTSFYFSKYENKNF